MPLFGCFSGKSSEEEKQRKKQHKKIEDELVKDRRKYKSTQRLLLLGRLLRF
jgi:hypothetical protein